MTTLSYKPNYPSVLERLRTLYERRAGNQIFATMSVPSPAIAEFARQHTSPECGYPDPHQRADFWDRLLAEHMATEDDALPSAYLSEFDQGL
jgi:hypothetical protein